MQYRPVTSGQSLGDAATLTFVWTGRAIRPHEVSDIRLSEDGSHDWIIEFSGHERLSEAPATFIVEVWADSTRNNPANIKRRLPVTYGAAQAALLIASTGRNIVIGGQKPYNSIQSDYTGKNTVTSGAAATLQLFQQIYARIDFTLISPAAPTFAAAEHYGLIEDSGVDLPSENFSLMPCYLSVIQGAASTVDVEIRNYNTLITTKNYTYTQWQAGVRFSILIVGNEYRVYQSYAFGNPPLAVIATPGAGPTFPLRGYFNLGNNTDCYDIQIAAGTALRSIYSAREQVVDFGSVPPALNLRIYQKSLAPRPDGVPVDIALQTLGGHVLLETGDDLLLETGDFVLKE